MFESLLMFGCNCIFNDYERWAVAPGQFPPRGVDEVVMVVNLYNDLGIIMEPFDFN